MYGANLSGRMSIGENVIEYDPGRGRYRRVGGDGSVLTEVDLSGEYSLILEPIHSLYIPGFITKYLLVEFAQKVVLPPASSRVMSLSIPVDLGVFMVGREYYELIDVAPLLSYYKYAFYGPLASLEEVNGVVCRHWRSQIYNGKMGLGLGECVLEAEIINETNSVASVSKILLDSSFLSLYYEANTSSCYVGRVRLIVRSRDRGDVVYVKTQVPHGYVRANIPGELKPPPIPVIAWRTEMLWGL